MVSKLKLTPVREGMLYSKIGKSVERAISLK